MVDALYARFLICAGPQEVENVACPVNDKRYVPFMFAMPCHATMLQSALLQDYKSKEWNEPHGQEATGSGPLNRLYQGSDGWLFLSARADELARCADLEASCDSSWAAFFMLVICSSRAVRIWTARWKNVSAAAA